MLTDLVDPKPLSDFAQRNGWLAADDKIVNLSIPGEGNMNRVVRATLASGSSLIFKQALPYVAKYPDIAAPVNRLDAEYAFYQALGAKPSLHRATPEIYGFSADEHLLCMQDLGATQDCLIWYQPGQPATGVAEPIIHQLFEWLAELHSLPVTPADIEVFSNIGMRQLNHEHIFVLPLRADNGISLSADLADAAAGLRGDAELIEHISQLGARYLATARNDSEDCLLHGDFYPGSWLSDGSAGTYIIDPEFCFIGPAEFDVGIMLAHLLFAGFTLELLNKQLQAYLTGHPCDKQLAFQYAGVEIIRRLLGVAQLPLGSTTAEQTDLLSQARKFVTCP